MYNLDGLRTVIIQMLSGAEVEVYAYTVQNDMVSFQDKNAVLTVLIRFGYVPYEQSRLKKSIHSSNLVH